MRIGYAIIPRDSGSTEGSARDLGRDPLIAHCRGLASATEDVKWGDNLVFSVGEKMFASFHLPDGDPFSFKADPLVFDGLVQQDGVEPAPYLARHHWLSVARRDALPLDVLRELLSEAHRLVAAKLPKKTRRALGLEGTTPGGRS